MNRIIILFIFLATLSCDDGNFDIPEFQFSSIDPESCGDVVLYKVNENETLIIEINTSLPDAVDSFLTNKWDNEVFTVSESGANKIIYRTLSEKPTNNYFCQNIPPTSPKVISEWIGTGSILVNTEFSEDDNDNVDEEVNEDIDLDKDGFPNYIDSDDDGDGIPTSQEDLDGDGDPTNDDTDGDGIPDYLEEDDDNDGTLTKFESKTEDANGNDIVDYRDPETTTKLPEARPVKNSYDKIYVHTIRIEPLKLTNENGNPINRDVYEFGTIEEIKTETQE
ncbi:hypothetical protein UMM65_07445 [Aureibaculum sp. 2210JD6-5]|uniref:hypothetical protein n=1 Tax=Aureibaculum sp. 2210JD6-5 TaxID=3103957 RepID=UPI002AACB755|nr:hypothetical protein [Aureibaculum sp. 2210JD6-5]MDY7395071.1 hypothetical protein [Aureibaculum sp. 2210JD6-5]